MNNKKEVIVFVFGDLINERREAVITSIGAENFIATLKAKKPDADIIYIRESAAFYKLREACPTYGTWQLQRIPIKDFVFDAITYLRWQHNSGREVLSKTVKAAVDLVGHDTADLYIYQNEFPYMESLDAETYTAFRSVHLVVNHREKNGQELLDKFVTYFPKITTAVQVFNDPEKAYAELGNSI